MVTIEYTTVSDTATGIEDSDVCAHAGLPESLCWCGYPGSIRVNFRDIDQLFHGVVRPERLFSKCWAYVHRHNLSREFAVELDETGQPNHDIPLQGVMGGMRCGLRIRW